MAALSWLLIPLLAAVAAGVWGSWAGRRRSTTPDSVGVAGYERFREAMERSRPAEQSTAGKTSSVPASAAPVAAGEAPARTAD